MATLSLTDPVLVATEGNASANAGRYSFSVELSEPSPADVSFSYRVFGDTAFAGDDVRADRGNVRIPAGETAATINVPLRPDSLAEPDEQFLVELFNISGADFAGGEPALTAIGLIRDDDRADTRPSLLLTDTDLVEGDEGQREASFRVNLTRPLDTTLEVDYRALDGDAQAGSDYAQTAGTLTFAPGQTEAVVNVPVFGDALSEPTEAFFLAFDAPSDQVTANGPSGIVGTARIRDDDADQGFPAIISVTDAPVDTEGDASATAGRASFVVALSRPASTQVEIAYRVIGDTAFQGNDVRDDRGVVRIQEGETTAVVNVPVRPDSLDEPDERFFVEFYNPSGAVFAGDLARLTASAQILDDDSGDTRPSLVVDDPTILEGDQGTSELVFTVSLSRPLPAAQTIAYTTVDGTARAGLDYTAVDGNLSFAAGQTEAFVRVPVLTDVLAEAPETFSLVVTPPEAQVTANGASGTTGTGQIRDDDGADGSRPVLSIADAPADTEGNASSNAGVGTFLVTLSQASETQVRVDYRVVGDTAEAGTDVRNDTGAVRFAPGETTAVIRVPTQPDSIAELDERWFVELSNPSAASLAGGAATMRASSVILDDDGSGRPPALFVSDAQITESTAGTVRAQIEVELSRPLDNTVIVDVVSADGTARSGEDFALLDQNVVFQAGQTQATVDVDIFGGAPAEGAETFSLNLSARDPGQLANANTSGTITIANNPESTGTTDLLALSAAERASAFYVGYYGRSPEPAGLAFWTDFIGDELATGRADYDVINEVSARFRDAQETINLYPFLDRSTDTPSDPVAIRDFVADVYNNLFNRAPETAGLNFWAGEIAGRLDRGEPISDIIITIIGAAQNKDAFTIGNKIDVGQTYGGAFTNGQFEERGPDFPDPLGILDPVDGTLDSITNAQIAIAEAGGDMTAFKGDQPGIVGTTSDGFDG